MDVQGRVRFAVTAFLLMYCTASSVWAEQTLLNVSYDPTRELYKALNEAFIADWKAKTGEDVEIKMLGDLQRQRFHGLDDGQHAVDGVDAQVRRGRVRRPANRLQVDLGPAATANGGQ